jgi:hypothetical protein
MNEQHQAANVDGDKDNTAVDFHSRTGVHSVKVPCVSTPFNNNGPLSLEGAVSFSLIQMHEYQQLFGDLRRQYGMQYAIEYWIDELLEDWLKWITSDSCEQPQTPEDAAWLAYLAIGISEVLSIRDVLILTLLRGVTITDSHGDIMNISVDMLKLLASRPHHSQQVIFMASQLDIAFQQQQGSSAVLRCRNGIAALSLMCTMVPQEYRSQALATIAYINWWLGDAAAVSYAQQALSLDSGCSLASIVLCALEHNIRPKGTEKHQDRE